jgi:membrane-anchored glycerophosphoryl diester phosphodiesterase (GDPDase)
VPGIILSVRLSFVPFLVIDEGRGPVEALLESWRRTSGYGWTIFGAFLLGIVIFLVGLIILIVGSIPATMLIYLAFASLYAGVTARQSTA